MPAVFTIALATEPELEQNLDHLILVVDERQFRAVVLTGNPTGRIDDRKNSTLVLVGNPTGSVVESDIIGVPDERKHSALILIGNLTAKVD